ncbi:MAG TPA: DUF3187 family protein [Burkholderiales bacterium]|nr:DUF3187 family protein [Burkholderiales bacterium]
MPFAFASKIVLALLMAVVAALPGFAQEAGRQAAPAYEKFGLLRERDLTPFGFLRLDMHPANAAWIAPGTWGVEVQLGYQNTWAMSPNVEQYLKSLSGRRQLGPAEAQAIRALPGEAYLVDLELGIVDVTLHRQITEHWSVNGTFSAVRYTGGFLDGGIEAFHRAFGLDSFGRPAVNRNNINVILDLKGSQATYLNAIPDGGVLDPTFGLRYSLAASPSPWNLVLESAVKVPVDGERNFLSTGNTDVGLQATLQRFAGRHAGYASAAIVRTQGSALTTNERTEYIPTYIFGYEFSMAQRTSAIAQFYVSPSVLTHDDTDLRELLETKYQLSLGVRHRTGGSVFSFAITENTGHINNTPDIGFQLGWTYSPPVAR